MVDEGEGRRGKIAAPLPVPFRKQITKDSAGCRLEDGIVYAAVEMAWSGALHSPAWDHLFKDSISQQGYDLV